MSKVENRFGITVNRTPDLGQSLFEIIGAAREIKRLYAEHFNDVDAEVADEFWRVADRIEKLAGGAVDLIDSRAAQDADHFTHGTAPGERVQKYVA